MMHLVADVLDKQVVDVRGRNAGRVDGIVVEWREGKPPLVFAIEIGPITLLSRFSRRLAQWYARRDVRLGHGRGTPFAFPWSRIRRGPMTVTLDCGVEDTPIDALEDWLRVHIVERIPWS